jgi:two-component sensor histidine kinase
MRKLICCLCVLAPLACTYSQNSPYDSLEQRLTAVHTDAQRLEVLSGLTNLAFGIDFTKALGYAKQGVALAERSNDKGWQPKFYEMQGRMHANLGQLDSANLFFEKAMKGYEAVGNKKGKATTLFKIAWVHNRKGAYEPALKFNLDALRIMEELGDQEGIASALGRVSDALYRQDKATESLEYAKRGIAICQINGFKQAETSVLQSAAYACMALGDYEQALTYCNQSLELALKLGMGQSIIADNYNARGNAFKKSGRYAEALSDYKNCLGIAEKVKYKSGVLAATANLGEVNLLLENYAGALPYQLKAIQLQEESNDLANLTENYGHVSNIYEHLGDFKSALLYQKKARKMRDSTASIKSDAAMSELQTRYETEKKEATIAAQTVQLSQQRTVQWLTLGIAGLLGLFAFSFYKNAAARKKANALLSAKNAENELLFKEIHHRVKNNLEVVSSLLALQSAQVDDPNVKDAMLEGQNRVQSIGIVHQKLYQGENLAAVEMKDYFLNLSDSILDSFGADDRVSIECAMNQLELDIDTAVPLGLIVNEVLTNALKYAFPDGRKGRIQINLQKKDDNTLQLSIADDGVGKSGAIKGTGFGGQLVSLLTKQLGGELREEVKSGTMIYLDFKVKKAA